MSSWNRILPVVAGAIAGGLIALAVSSGSGSSHSTTTTVISTPSRSSALPTTFTPSHGMSINQIYRSASPGVVDITVTSNAAGQGFPFFGGGAPQQQGEGAGVVYDTNGDILTDEHVVSGAQSINVKFEDGKTVGAHVVGTDPSTDVAVIHVNAPSSELHPIPFANSSNAQVGDPVVAIGSPFSLPETITTGIVSQTGRSITAPNNYTITGALQTDAPINPGNSGGPLLDSSAHVLGLNDQIDTNNTTPSGEGSSSGVGFAIPSNTAARIANLIISGKHVSHAYVGVELNAETTGGAQVTSVSSGSPAQSAGLQPNDLVTAINGKKITSTQQFIETVDTYSPGQTISLTVKRGGQTQTVQLKLGTRPETTPTG
jgi:S1-C subfamily serine protease